MNDPNEPTEVAAAKLPPASILWRVVGSTLLLLVDGLLVAAGCGLPEGWTVADVCVLVIVATGDGIGIVTGAGAGSLGESFEAAGC